MHPSLSRRLATPIIAAGAAITLILAGAGVAVAYDPATTPPASTGDQSTDNLRWNLSLTAVNGAPGSNIAHPGDTVTFTSKIWKNSGIGRYMTAIRQIQPAGFEYVSHTISKLSNVTPEGAAGVKATCTGGGCNSVPVIGTKGYLDNVDFAVTYKIPLTQATGDYNAGFKFDVYTFGSQQGGSGAWVRVVAPTTTTLEAPANATAGTAVDLTATVDPANAGGTVQFKDGGVDIGGAVSVSGGTATLSHTFVTLGTHNVTAVYTSGTGFDNSKSAVSAVEVGAPAVDTTTTLSVPPTTLTGTAVDLTATVTPANAAGTVQFKDGGVDIGGAVAVSGGTATLSHTFDTVAAHSITAEFVASAGFHNSKSAVSAVEVGAPAVDTTTTLSVPPTTLTGTAVDLTATVTPANAAGTVQFKDGGVDIGGAVAVSGGTATLSHTFDTVAAHSITAEFVASAGFHNSTSAASVIDVTAPILDTTTTLTAPPTTLTGTAVDLTATVTPANAAGTVQFKDGGVDIGGAVAVSGGTATLSHTFDTVAAHSITAEFVASAGFHNSTSAASVIDVTAPILDTTTTLTAPTDALTGTAVDLTATVTPANAAGTVQFKDGGVDIGGAVAVSGGTATLSHTFDTVAAHSITAEFVAGAGFAGSTSTPSTVVVSDPIPSDTETTTTVTESATAVAGTPVVLSANVSPAPTGGDVKFLVDNVVVGSGQVGTDGVATLSHTFTAAGTPNVVAQFVGTTGFAASTSAQFSVTVTAATPTDVETTTTLDTIGALDTNTPVVLKATVNPTTANGKVQFKVGNTLIGAPVDVVNGVATLTHTFTGAGTFNVTAEFIGADGFADSAATPKTANVTDATDPGTPGGTGSLGSLSGIFGS